MLYFIVSVCSYQYMPQEGEVLQHLLSCWENTFIQPMVLIYFKYDNIIVQTEALFYYWPA